ncbi:M3 family metallopeptidase [Raineyella sp. LH-20]|uniref:M3 family metallopeptidase n=1 Tax=Raineyella sp. LH-20 TaxID=3081204 RepID=UPI002952FC97|nr:M3 family metallopeptidase [Raineyella sp. LH-20]WOP19414.1 M3 family metallopeptidase [Raineyella sp. LH-20]
MTGLAPLHLPAPEHAADWLAARRTGLLAEVEGRVADLRAAGTGDPLAVLRSWNDITLALSDLTAVGSVYAQVHPDEAVRALGDRVVQQASKVSTELSLDPGLYAVFAALDPAALLDPAGRPDPVARRLLDRVLRDFRRSGVDRDETTRTRLRELDSRQVDLGQQLSRTIRADVRSVRVTPAQLAGLPEDWIAAHPADADGLVTVTTDYPDAVPFLTFAEDAAARRALRLEFLNRGWPDNDAVLRELFAVRREVADLLGYADWPDYASEVMMIGDGDAIPAFIDRIADLALEPGRRDRAVLLERLRCDVPEADTIDVADSAYYAELVRREQFDVDAQQVRRYFAVDKVRRGLLEVTGRLFGLTYVPVDPVEAGVWHPEVATYDVFRRPEGEGSAPGERIGRIHLDLHPRDGKYKHAAQFTLAEGVRDRRLPEGVLVCNFPRGLMQHDEVVTLFHEFGHLVHHVLGGRSEWVRFSGVATEWDFVEAPSQLLEEWAWDPAVLETFATDEAGEPIPADLVARMRRAEDFGKGYHARTQMFYAALAYDLHAREHPDLTARVRELQGRYSMFPYLEGTHFHCSFGHLDGYSSGYYTYAWSQVIAKDLFSAFDPDDLFEPTVAARYRDTILARGGERNAADLVEDFLGRPSTFDAYAAWLAR